MSALVTRYWAPTLITEGSRIQGNLSFQTTTEVHGLVEGDIALENADTLLIGRNGHVLGSIQAGGEVRIEGRVDGNILCSHTIRLSSNARVKGVLHAPRIEIQAGAYFDGELQMTPQTTTRTKKRAA